MNILQGNIIDIKTSGEISQVFIDVNGMIFSSILLDANTMDLKIKDNVEILFKETEVLVATITSKISAKNSFFGEVKDIKKGEILSEISFAFQNTLIKSIITTNSVQALDIAIGGEFLWLVKANEITLRTRNQA
ncbi:TOBE domain-containing protein [Arcobacter sp. FWKO B]|uniref:TOBE domain-containing protein n=1 Tax=Arcobacter sp. FWKO B TaxID=2593672 RepID=UPI0018A4F57F|nr:TOBE domain-containing protein [Arcobacter sp. FWKO B]QOG12420.1 molybdenum-pterin-binding protein [Arcobacter sp. FWKO B]